jgi:hypothetical protein
MDSRNRSAVEILHDLRVSYSSEPCLLAVVGAHELDAHLLADVFRTRWPQLVAEFKFGPKRVMTGCADVGAEKAARLAAKSVTGKLAIVFHRAEASYGRKGAEKMRDDLLAQEADGLLLVTTRKNRKFTFLRERFAARAKPIVEVEIE